MFSWCMCGFSPAESILHMIDILYREQSVTLLSVFSLCLAAWEIPVYSHRLKMHFQKMLSHKQTVIWNNHTHITHLCLVHDMYFCLYIQPCSLLPSPPMVLGFHMWAVIAWRMHNVRRVCWLSMEPGWQDGGWAMQLCPLTGGLINPCVCMYVCT